MKKSFIGAMVVLCAVVFMMMASTSYAANYDGWSEEIVWAEGDTVDIDGVSYSYGGDVSTTGVYLGRRIGATDSPNGNTIYTAGDGYVLYDCTDGTKINLTLHNASINVTTGDALTLSISEPINMILEGENSLKAAGDSYCALKNWMAYGTEDELTISGSGSLNAEAYNHTIYLARPIVVNEGNIVSTSEAGPAIIIQNDNNTFIVNDGSVKAVSNSRTDEYGAFVSMHDGLVVNGGNVEFVAENGANAVEVATKIDLCGNAVANITGPIIVNRAVKPADLSAVFSMADTVTGSVCDDDKTIKVIYKDDCLYTRYKMDGTELETDFETLIIIPDISGYDENSTLEENGYEVEFQYDQNQNPIEYTLTLGSAFDYKIILSPIISGKIVIEEDLVLKKSIKAYIYNDGVSTTFTGDGKLTIDNNIDLGNAEVKFEDIEVEVKCKDGLYFESTLDIWNSTIKANETDWGIYVDDKLTIKDSIVDIKSVYSGLESYELAIDNSNVYVQVSDDGDDTTCPIIVYKYDSTPKLKGVEILVPEEGTIDCVEAYNEYIQGLFKYLTVCAGNKIADTVVIEKVKTPITSAKVDIEAPVKDKAPASKVTLSDDASYTVSDIVWENNPVKFQTGVEYVAKIELTPKDGYKFTADTDVSVKGATVEKTLNNYKSITVKAIFEALQDDSNNNENVNNNNNNDNNNNGNGQTGGTQTDIPETGDNASILLLCLIGIVSAAFVVMGRPVAQEK